MEDDTRWRGGRLGPYNVGRRVRGLGSAPGRLYEAQHAETGAPALIMMPGRKDDWGPRERWQVRATAHDTPPFLALEVERAPRAGPLAIQELTLLFHRLARILTRVEDRKEMREYLTGPAARKGQQAARGRGTRWMRRGLAVAAVVGLALVVTVVLWLRSEDREARRAAPGVATTVLEKEEDIFLARDNGLEPDALARPMPDKPVRGQKKPPCTTPPQVEVRGGCWIAIEDRPPCPKHTAEYEGKCYVGVADGTQAPVSLEPSAPNPPAP